MTVENVTSNSNFYASSRAQAGPAESSGVTRSSSPGLQETVAGSDSASSAVHTFPVTPEALSAYLEALDLHLPASVTVSLGTLRDALLGYLSEVEWAVREKLGVESITHEPEPEVDDDCPVSDDRIGETDSLLVNGRPESSSWHQGGTESPTTAHEVYGSRYGALASSMRRRGGDTLRRTLSGGGPASTTVPLQLPIPSADGILAHLAALKEDVASCLPSLPTLPELRHLGDAALHSMPTAPSAESLQNLYLSAIARHNLSLAIPGLFQTLPQRLFLLQTTLRGVQDAPGSPAQEGGSGSSSKAATEETPGNRERVMQLVHKLLPSEEWAGWEKLGWDDPMHPSRSSSGLATPSTDPSLSFFARPTGHRARRHSHGSNLARILSGGWSDWTHGLPNNPLTRRTSADSEPEATDGQTGGEDAVEEEPEWLFPNKTPRAAMKRQQSYEVSVQVRRDEAARRASRRRAASIDADKGERRDSVGSATESLRDTGDGVSVPSQTIHVESTDPSRDWTYIAEGGANTVYAFAGDKIDAHHPLTGKVIRVRKRSYQGANLDLDRSAAEANAYFHGYMLPSLVSERYLARQEKVDVDSIWIRRLEMAHEAARPQIRLEEGSRRPSVPGADVDDGGRASKRQTTVAIMDNLLGGVGHIAVEIKPKTGYVPSIAALSPSAAVKTTQCRFCLHRRMRIRQSTGTSLEGELSKFRQSTGDLGSGQTSDPESPVAASHAEANSDSVVTPESSAPTAIQSHWAQWGYCPLDLYSGDRDRIGCAVNELVRGWKASNGEGNNFRLFVGGEGVKPGLVANGIVNLGTSAVQQGNTMRLREIATKVAADLASSSLMAELKRLQRGMFGDEDIERLWDDLVDWGERSAGDSSASIAEALREPTRSELEDLMHHSGLTPGLRHDVFASVQGHTEVGIRLRLLAFGISATFKDCSIIVQYPLLLDSQAESLGKHIGSVPSAHDLGTPIIKLVDLDLKPMSKFRKWLELDREILRDYADSAEHGVCDRTTTYEQADLDLGEDTLSVAEDGEDLAGAIARAKAAALAAALQAAEADPEAAAQLELDEELAAEDATTRQMLAAYGPSISDVLEKSHQGTRLIGYEDLPIWMQNNEYLHFGYRFIPFHPKLGPLPLLGSILQWHNETINIHTHLIPTLVLLAFVIPYTIVYPPLTDAAPLDIIVLMTFLLSAASCLLSSAGWHLLSGCSHRGVFEWGACVDYVGISWLISASIMTVFYNGFYCQGRTLLLYCILTLGSAVTGSILPFQQWFNERRNKGKRILFFLCSSFVAVAPLTHLAVVHGLAEMLAFASPILPSICSYVGGLLFYAFHFPESRWPGRLDCLGNSHQIWHLAIVMAVYLHYEGSLAIFESRHSMSCALPNAGTPMSEHLRGFSAYFSGAIGEVTAIL